jgi:hypothetical protein
VRTEAPDVARDRDGGVGDIRNLVLVGQPFGERSA